ncbi:MAG: protein-methionine-sulfoxide reductase catalytic subunit MsrP [Rhodothermales bacterium]
MAHIILPPGWHLKENQVTSASAYRNRRAFLKTLGLGSIGLMSTATAFGCTRSGATGHPDPEGPLDTIPANAPRDGYPAPRNTQFSVPERPLTDRLLASSYNNYYEFISQGNLKLVWPHTGTYEPFPGTLEVSGLVEKPLTLDVADLTTSMDLEERIYRFRCVEAWSMTVPWTGFPLRTLIERCNPLSTATHVRFVSVNRPKQMPGIPAAPWYPWPYFEGLRMDEAMNELAFVATGLYGEPLPKQNGSSLRMVLPWKYGYKGPKAITRIEFTDKQPPTFWNELQPTEYGFLSNVNPNVPHPRWSQATERFLPRADVEERIETQLFNGYEEWVAALYPDEPRTPTGPMAR